MRTTLTVKQAAEIVNVNERTVYRMTNGESFPLSKWSAHGRFLEQDTTASRARSGRLRFTPAPLRKSIATILRLYKKRSQSMAAMTKPHVQQRDLGH
jgi:hypothetical protein